MSHIATGNNLARDITFGVVGGLWGFMITWIPLYEMFIKPFMNTWIPAVKIFFN